jgi:transposase InsO family protein
MERDILLRILGVKKVAGLKPRMSSKVQFFGIPLGNNSPTERFFRSLKHEQLTPKSSELKHRPNSIIDYLAFYNGKRTRSKLGYQTPLNFERDFYRKAA